ncbi:hypothetical protein GDO81_016895 [Engystomops pustulosus]|uniref:Uromodulin n=1 Tax=Engystomops pustulosus TaxID=76066 RepID=A0AAV7AGE3_ENGPU|nr:hypothetical protein GDO81_016895 [Engystomops pustulosus]
MTPFAVFLIFIFTHMVASQYYYGTSMTTSSHPECKGQEGTSFTFITDKLFPWSYENVVENFVNRVSQRIPCVQRQYTLIRVNNSDITESVAETKLDFIKKLHDYDFWYYYNQYINYYFYSDPSTCFCNQFILHGLKRALEISPKESFILTLSSGSVADHNNSEVLSEIYRLLDEKKSQVYFINYDHCASELQEGLLYNLVNRSFGFYSKTNKYKLSDVFYGLDLFLLKPLNYSLPIFNLDITSMNLHREEFDVMSSLSFIMISVNGKENITFTDPNGKTPVYERTLSHYTGNTYLVKYPVSGTWTLEIYCQDVCSIRIWGVAGFGSQGNCSSYDCAPWASCEEFGGYQECTCTNGFEGDGSFCHDINECENFYLSNCNPGNAVCVNTIGSFNCICHQGLEYVENEGCVDFDECQNHVCHPLAQCTNYYGSYFCACPDGYHGDGRFCDLECQNASLCDSDTNCNVSLEETGCWDPCNNHSVVSDKWRLSTFRSHYSAYFYSRCDNNMRGWYRFQGNTEWRIPEHCIEEYSCGTDSPLWLRGSHPKVEDGTVNATICATWDGNCCMWTHPISIRACPGGYYVYKIHNTPLCYSAYCTEPIMENLNCSSVYCAEDEECRALDGQSECHCRNNHYSEYALETTSHAKTIYPDLVCEPSRIILSYSKCMLESMGYDTSSIHLKDRTCTGIIVRENKSYIRFEILPRSGYCGAELKVGKTHMTYINSVYLSQRVDNNIQRNQAVVNFSCSYPLNMEVSLWTAINPFVSSLNFSIGGTGLYVAKMALYQDSSYSRPYEGSDVWLSTDSMLYVGVMVEEIQESYLVLLMKNCYATPTSNSEHPVKYYIIKDNCPNRNDPSISVQQNGVSLHGRVSIQVFRFLRGYDQVYLHCQIRLCDTSTGSCIPNCSGMRSAIRSLDNEKDTIMTLGPIHQKVLLPIPKPVPAPAPAPLSSCKGVTTSLIILILALCSNLVTSQ